MSTTISTEKRLGINVLEVTDFKGLKFLRLEPNGNHVKVSGPNSKGKTSVLDIIPWIVGMKTARELGEPVHRGADKATGYLELGPPGGPTELILKRTLNAEGVTRVFAKAADGSPIKNQAEVIEALVGKYMLDPIAFVDKLRPQDQVDEFLAVSKLQPPVKEIEEITGERHEPRAGESGDAYMMRLSADETGLYYVRRREQFRIVEQKRKAHTEQSEALDNLGGPLTADETPRSATDLLKQIEALQAKDAERRAAIMEAEDAKREWEEGQRRHAARLGELTTVRGEIARLKDLLAKAEAHEKELVGIVETNEKALAEMKNDADQAAEYAAKIPDVQSKMTAIRTQIGTIDEHNKRHARRAAAQQERDRLLKEVTSSQELHADIDLKLTRIRDFRRHWLDGAASDFDVAKGSIRIRLEVGDGELRVNGVPLRAAARNEQLIAGGLIAMAQKPRPPLPILRIDEAERLDPEHEALMLELANERGYEVVYSRVNAIKLVQAGEATVNGVPTPLYREEAQTELEAEIIVAA